MKLRTLSKPFARSAKAILTGSIAALAIFSAHTVRANNTWDGGGGATFLWSNNVNWGGDTAPAYGTLIFTGAVGTTNIMDANYSMNQLNWNGSSAWVLNNSGGSVLSLFDNGGTQAKLESLGTGGVTINAPVTFAATAGAAWGEINAVSSSITFGSGGTLTVNGSAVAGIRLFGGSGAISTTFNNTVSASGALVVNSRNTSGTNTLSNQIALDSALKITQSVGGTLDRNGFACFPTP